jgi:hypothetical protein
LSKLLLVIEVRHGRRANISHFGEAAFAHELDKSFHHGAGFE